MLDSCSLVLKSKTELKHRVGMEMIEEEQGGDERNGPTEMLLFIIPIAYSCHHVVFVDWPASRSI